MTSSNSISLTSDSTTRYMQLQAELKISPKIWLITGVADFIGSNLLETLLKLYQKVVGLDNFATSHQHNLDELQSLVTTEQWSNFNFIKGNITKLGDCQQACKGVNYVLHQAVLGSVLCSIVDPITTNNISGFLNMLVAARDANVASFTYAVSSSIYSGPPALSKLEDDIGKPLSSYAVTKYVNELYVDVFATTYGFNTIGLCYFNVFGKRQALNGAYVAVIPKRAAVMLQGEQVFINGDVRHSQADVSKARIPSLDALHGIAALAVVLYHYTFRYDVIYGHEFSLEHLFVFKYGYLGLQLFFMISGFVIYLSLENTTDIKKFALKRFARLYPAYWFAVILTFLVVLAFSLPDRDVSFLDMLANLSMLNGFIGIPSVDGVYWTLRVELSFYFFIASLYFLKSKNKF